MGMFKKQNNLKLDRRTDTTISVTVAPNNPDFTSVVTYAHTISVQQLTEELGTSATDGLSKNEAVRRLETHGENLLQGKDGISAWSVFVKQLGSCLLPRLLITS
jgi:P-type Na+/K+ transporter